MHFKFILSRISYILLLGRSKCLLQLTADLEYHKINQSFNINFKAGTLILISKKKSKKSSLHVSKTLWVSGMQNKICDIPDKSSKNTNWSQHVTNNTFKFEMTSDTDRVMMTGVLNPQWRTDNSNTTTVVIDNKSRLKRKT